MKKTVSALLAALLLCSGMVAEAGVLADLSIISRTTGRALPVYRYQGRYYVAGTPGEKYAVSVHNKLGQRIMAVVSVDGVNVVSGETAAADQNGYVLWSSMQYDINGWRKSTDEVAAFVFTSLPDSYAARTNRPGNVGVIGLAVFREYEPPRPVILPAPMSRGDLSNNMPGKAADASAEAGGASADKRVASEPAAASPALRLREEKLGTGHGEREVSQVSYTDFQRASERPAEMIAIYYDSYRNLVARGIIPQSSRLVPNPFPGGGQFVPDPRS